MKSTTTLHTVEPATRWEDAMPLGNGSLFTRLGDDMARAMAEMMKK